MADNPLTKLPLVGQLAVSLLVAALIGGGFYYLWYSDALEQEKTKQARLETLSKEIRALEVTASKLQEFQREVQLLEAKLETLKRILPPEKETPDLMRRVQYLASQSSLLIKDFTPAPVATKEFYQEGPINVGVEVPELGRLQPPQGGAQEERAAREQREQQVRLEGPGGRRGGSGRGFLLLFGRALRRQKVDANHRSPTLRTARPTAIAADGPISLMKSGSKSFGL